MILALAMRRKLYSEVAISIESDNDKMFRKSIGIYKSLLEAQDSSVNDLWTMLVV